jgi:hypothetical protein
MSFTIHLFVAFCFLTDLPIRMKFEQQQRQLLEHQQSLPECEPVASIKRVGCGAVPLGMTCILYSLLLFSSRILISAAARGWSLSSRR